MSATLLASMSFLHVPPVQIYWSLEDPMLDEHTSGEIARHSTFEINGKKMTTSTNLVSVHTNLLYM